MTPPEMIAAVRRAAEAAGGQNALARKWGVPNAYISDVLRGQRAPGAAILRPLGLKRVKVVTITYEPGEQPYSSRWHKVKIERRKRRYLP